MNKMTETISKGESRGRPGIGLQPMQQNSPAELLVFDGTDECPYLPGRTARMPLRLPTSRLSAQQLDVRLAEGDRRSGAFLYRTQCPSCCACEPIRVLVDEFTPSRTQRRVLQLGNRRLQSELGPPEVSSERVQLFNAHRQARDLVGRDGDLDIDGYASFLADTCCDTFEIRYRLGEKLIAVAICDFGSESLSAVYCYFDPAFSSLSPGVYSILKQIELCRQWELPYLYLGLYIAESPHMSYKARYVPHQRLISGRWQRFDKRESRPAKQSFAAQS